MAPRSIPWGGLVVLVAVAVRGAYLHQLWGSEILAVLTGDAAAYHDWGARIARGDWIGRDVFFQAPLYPYFLGVVYAVVGPNPFAARVVQAGLGTLACWLLYRAGRRLFSPGVGAIAGLLLAGYPTAVFFDGILQKSALDLVFTTALLCVLGRLVSRPLARDWLVAGALVGCLALTRENALALAPVLAAWCWLRFRAERLAWIARFALGLALVLVPVAVRNLAVGGEFVLTTSQLGPNLYIGNNPRATGRYVALQGGHGNAADERLEATRLAEQAVGRRLNAGEVSRYWAREAVAWIVAHPADWLRLTAKKSVLLANTAEVTDTEDQGTYAEYSSLLAFLSHWLHFGILFPFAAAGVALTIRDRGRLAVLYVVAATLAVSTVVFFVVARYRLPLVPLLALFAAAGVREIFVTFRARRWTPVVPAACVAGAAAVLSNWPVIAAGSQRAPTHYNLGLARAARGDVDGAGREFAEAVALDPNLGVAWGNLGIVHAMKGEMGEAERCFREALRRDPDLAETHANLGTLLEADGRRDEAIAHYREAVRLRPWGAGLESKLGMALLGDGRIAEAIDVLGRAVASDESDGVAHYGLGAALAAQGRSEPALAHLRRARVLAEASHDDALVRDVDARIADVVHAGG